MQKQCRQANRDAGDASACPLESRQSASLARSTKKRRTLGLNDSHDLLASRAAWADFARSVVHAVMLLIAALLIERVAISAVTQRRALVPNRRFQNGSRRIGYRLPLGPRN